MIEQTVIHLIWVPFLMLGTIIGLQTMYSFIFRRRK